MSTLSDGTGSRSGNFNVPDTKGPNQNGHAPGVPRAVNSDDPSANGTAAPREPTVDTVPVGTTERDSANDTTNGAACGVADRTKGSSERTSIPRSPSARPPANGEASDVSSLPFDGTEAGPSHSNGTAPNNVAAPPEGPEKPNQPHLPQSSPEVPLADQTGLGIGPRTPTPIPNNVPNPGIPLDNTFRSTTQVTHPTHQNQEQSQNPSSETSMAQPALPPTVPNIPNPEIALGYGPPSRMANPGLIAVPPGFPPALTLSSSITPWPLSDYRAGNTSSGMMEESWFPLANQAHHVPDVPGIVVANGVAPPVVAGQVAMETTAEQAEQAEQVYTVATQQVPQQAMAEPASAIPPQDGTHTPRIEPVQVVPKDGEQATPATICAPTINYQYLPEGEVHTSPARTSDELYRPTAHAPTEAPISPLVQSTHDHELGTGYRWATKEIERHTASTSQRVSTDTNSDDVVPQLAEPATLPTEVQPRDSSLPPETQIAEPEAPRDTGKPSVHPDAQPEPTSSDPVGQATAKPPSQLGDAMDDDVDDWALDTMSDLSDLSDLSDMAEELGMSLDGSSVRLLDPTSSQVTSKSGQKSPASKVRKTKAGVFWKNTGPKPKGTRGPGRMRKYGSPEEPRLAHNSSRRPKSVDFTRWTARPSGSLSQGESGQSYEQSYERANAQIGTLIEIVHASEGTDDWMRVSMLEGLDFKHAGSGFWEALLDSGPMLEILLHWTEELVPQPKSGKKGGNDSGPRVNPRATVNQPTYAYAAPLYNLLHLLLDYLPRPTSDPSLGAKLVSFGFDRAFRLIEERTTDVACKFQFGITSVYSLAHFLCPRASILQILT